MDETAFWAIVEDALAAAPDDMDERCEALKRLVLKLDPTGAAAFRATFDRIMHQAYAWELWGAAYVIHGGCGDDTFSDFRASLISRGRAAFEAALRDPDSLADEEFDDDLWFYEGYQYAVTEAVMQVCGRDLPRTMLPANPSGVKFEEDKVYGLYPRLSAKFA